jgi:2-C-methyl-D-erythritol 4-phosphate cytidylyltransferase/2-C-methyl-D-erythritol 2,4-cyclodiphosphate synthase
MPRLAVVILAAGKGSRMALGQNKVFALLGDKPVLSWSVAAFSALSEVEEIIIAAAAAELDLCRELSRDFAKVKKIVQGGASRQQSVYNAVAAVSPVCNQVAVHDAARPFVSAWHIKSLLADALLHGSSVPAVPVKDTIKQADGHKIIGTLCRDQLFAAQTPQIFSKADLLSAHEKARAENFQASDDASLLEHYGFDVYLSPGEESNFKLTTPEDWQRAKLMIANIGQANKMRMGIGYDVHKLVLGRKLVLGGVTIEHPTGLWGHSDADVLCHAIADALFGAAAMGDIGRHFPDSNERYKGISSLLLLTEAGQKLTQERYRICNIDSIVIAQKPKLAPYISLMRANIAQALSISVEQISIKATTTETLGFCGREEGIAAQATALIESVAG